MMPVSFKVEVAANVGRRGVLVRRHAGDILTTKFAAPARNIRYLRLSTASRQTYTRRAL